MDDTRDASFAEAKLADTLLEQARRKIVERKFEESVEITRGLVDRYWGQKGTRATQIALDSYNVYLDAAGRLAKESGQVRILLEQYDLLIERYFSSDRVFDGLQLVRRKARWAVRMFEEWTIGYDAATQLVLLLQKHKEHLPEDFEQGDIDDWIHDALKLRFEVRSEKQVFLGAVEDLTGFDLAHPDDLSYEGIYETADHLLDRGLLGPAFCLMILTIDVFPETASQGRDWVVENVPSDYFENPESHWIDGWGHLFEWRIPKPNYQEYIEILGRISHGASSEDETILKELIYSAVHNSTR